MTSLVETTGHASHQDRCCSVLKEHIG